MTLKDARLGYQEKKYAGFILNKSLAPKK